MAYYDFIRNHTALHRGDAENRTRVQTSSLKAFYIHSFCLILVL